VHASKSFQIPRPGKRIVIPRKKILKKKKILMRGDWN
jgi:hypothetical protein